MRPFAFVVVALAVYRITRLVVSDTLTEPLRERTTYKLREIGFSGWLKDLLDCPWCASIWLGAGATVMVFCWPRVTFWLSVPFALAAITGLISKNLDD